MYFRYYRRRYIGQLRNVIEVFFSELEPTEFIETHCKYEERLISADIPKQSLSYELELVHIITKEDYEAHNFFSIPIQQFNFLT